MTPTPEKRMPQSGAMTAEELYFKLKDDADHDIPIIREALKLAVDEARAEAAKTCDHSGPCDDCIDKFRAQGFLLGQEKMRERAAKSVQECLRQKQMEGLHSTASFLQDLEEEIRALSPTDMSKANNPEEK